ncbi:hypothetical protein B0H14DRAFT_3435655 [Mycena olivaceomarginata]|nr:hypothetical protein B0H14DRAFT_3435655 [Mycena olivaceomarginata]
MPDNPGSRATPYSLPLDFNVAEFLASSTIPSSAMESSPDPSFPRFSDDSENRLWVSSRTKIFHLERVTGFPSQIPITVEPTGFLINLTDIPNLGNETVDAILKDQDPSLVGWLYGGTLIVDCRRSPNAAAAMPVNLSLLSSSTLNAANLILVLVNRSFKLNCAPVRDRTILVLAKFSRMNSPLSICPAVDSTDPKKTCKGGHAVLKKPRKGGSYLTGFNERLTARQRLQNKDFILLCSNRDMFDSTVGDHEKPHRHPVPPPTKATHAVAEKYSSSRCLQAIGEIRSAIGPCYRA